MAKMAKKGYMQGDMKPMVEDCQLPKSAYSENFNDSTLMYKERHNRMEAKEASKLKGESYKGRYS